ncbi:hypothetical protein K488DRAFT_52957 [Vararia minispora EC-137]|uniref:Uncharacterized protein n=1 Tax=Vararia minispora EC-137 TaxID=1314806 RepID=A0ACB8QGR4_9AGAM|nr:hypothetical protein K488DRAFT_52957 [Vararia minispora EC-137]
MSPQHDGDSPPLPRPRSNTNSFANFAWRRKPEPATPTASVSNVHASDAKSVDELLVSLTPPAVPSLSMARQLVQALTSSPSLPKTGSILIVLPSLCSKDVPALRAVGFEALAAYLGNPSTPPLTDHDRYLFFSLFPPTAQTWTFDVWESAQRALEKLTRNGEEIVGIERPLLQLLTAWIDGSFAGLLSRDNIATNDRTERERSVVTQCAFLTRALSQLKTLARLGEEDVAGVLGFLGGLVERSLLLPSDAFGSSSPGTEPQTPQTPTRITHRRHHSSASVTLVSSHSSPLSNIRRPVDVAISVYLEHLSQQMRFLSPSHLRIILPTLFRALACYASLLPRLSLTENGEFGASHVLEGRIVGTLELLLNGAYASTCYVILKRHMLPLTDVDFRIALETSAGACRALRIYWRRALCARLARMVISKSPHPDAYAPSGAPGVDLDTSLLERAWAKDEVTRGDLSRVGRLFRHTAEAWVGLTPDAFPGSDITDREEVLSEIAGAIRDLFQEYDLRGDLADIDDEESSVTGGVLSALTAYIDPMKNDDCSPYIVPLSHYADAPTLFLRILASLLGRDQLTTPINPPLTAILLRISEHLSDADTSKTVNAMFDRGDLSPLSMEWIDNWVTLCSKPELTSVARPATRAAVLEALQNSFAFVRDVPVHRHPFVDVILQSCQSHDPEKGSRDGYEVVWHVLADELVLRMTEAHEHAEAAQRPVSDAHAFVDSVLDLLNRTAAEDVDADPEPLSPVPQPVQTPILSPTFSRNQSELVVAPKEKEPGIISLLSSFASGSRTQSQQAPRADDSSSVSVPLALPETTIMSAGVGAVVALIHIFSQLAFTPYALSGDSRFVAVRIFGILIDLLTTTKSARVRLAILQFFFRLRVDRDHRLYSMYKRYDRLGLIATLAGIIGRTGPPGSATDHSAVTEDEAAPVISPSRARAFQRDGRRASRGRDVRPDRSASSRSRSRVAPRIISPTELTPSFERPRKPLWHVPELLPFDIPESDTPSDGLMSYDPEGPGNRMVLPTSRLLRAFTEILHSERDWEILSYVLCHLPTFLANKHLFCGPNSRAAIAQLLDTLSADITSGELGKHIETWPTGLRARDAHGLAFHTLSVLISYRACFDAQRRHILVEVLMSGLGGGHATVKACIQALSIAAFELPSSVRRFLPDILIKLSQIMTNVSIATSIIDFLAIVGSQPTLYANFIERDFKMVFGVALQYLRLHNRPDSSESTSVLSQHVRLMSYYILYVWFLAVKQSDRSKHVKYITRQLLLANEGREDIDELTEVAFDWLARYTYGSADPRPASSMLSEIIMSPSGSTQPPDTVMEKSWLVGNALITIRSLMKRGWVEVNARRPSGLTRFLARVENLPMVGPGEVDPDTVSIPAVLAMDHEIGTADDALYQAVMQTISPVPDEPAADEEPPPRPNPITGYVWQRSAPSQRRKDVVVDPSFFALQLSTYPQPRQNTKIDDASSLPTFIRTFDRMPVIDTLKVGVLYVAPGQTDEREILGNLHGSPAYTRFLEGLGRLINLRGQVDVYAGGLDPDEDGEYAYAWWDDIGQILYHTATLMPNHGHDPHYNLKKRHIGNDFVRIVWNDSGAPYRFDTLSTEFQFCNIIIEAHSLGAIAAFSNSQHENEYFRVMIQRAPGMSDFAPVGDFKLISAENLPLLVRQLSLLADWYSSIHRHAVHCPGQEMETNWRARLRALKRFAAQQLAKKSVEPASVPGDGILAQESSRDFTGMF